jgi:hypothetical protein
MAKARGRIVLAIFTLAIVAYLPLWSRCTLSTTPLTHLNPPQPVVVVTKPCPCVHTYRRAKEVSVNGPRPSTSIVPRWHVSCDFSRLAVALVNACSQKRRH